jgi:hypothetical protein
VAASPIPRPKLRWNTESLPSSNGPIGISWPVWYEVSAMLRAARKSTKPREVEIAVRCSA